MIWFRKKKDDLNDPEQMSPLEAVTYLCAALQLADGISDDTERHAWLNIIAILFPDYSKERADKFLLEAHDNFSRLKTSERDRYIVQVLTRIRLVLNKDDVFRLSKNISKIVEADGIVLSSEEDLIKKIEQVLEVPIKLNEN